MITQQVTASDFWQWLQSSSGYKNNFTYEGAKAVFEYMEEASDNGEEQPDNFDPIAWCCEFAEYESLEELQKQYNNLDIETVEDLEYHTIVVSENPLVIAQF